MKKYATNAHIIICGVIHLHQILGRTISINMYGDAKYVQIAFAVFPRGGLGPNLRVF